MNNKVYRVVVVKQHRCRISTTLRKLEAAAAAAGVAVGAVYETREAAENALLAIEEHASQDTVLRVEYGDRVRVY